MNLVEIYRDLVNNPIKNSHTFYENRLFVCFYKDMIDLCMGKTSKDAESKFRQKHEIHMSDEGVIVPFRVRFVYGQNKIIDGITDEELDSKLHDIELIATKHTEYDYGYYSELSKNLIFWNKFKSLLKDLGGLIIWCRTEYNLYYLKDSFGDAISDYLFLKISV